MIEWTDSRSEHGIIRYLIESVGYFAIDKYCDIKVTPNDLKRYEERVNNFIEQYLKTDLRVKIPLIQKDIDDIAWCKARLLRKVEFVLV